jgi:hypothetical protein
LDGEQVEPQSEEALDALYGTGGVPFELDLFWKQPRNTLAEKTLVYREKRIRDMMDGHSKFTNRWVIWEERTWKNAYPEWLLDQNLLWD